MNNLRSSRAAAAVRLVAVLLPFLACRPTHEWPVANPPEVKELSQERWIEPRLTSAKAWAPCEKKPVANHLIAQSDCGSPYFAPRRVSFTNEACEKAMTTHGETLRLMITHPECIDAAVGWLEDHGKTTGDAHILSDLSAASYVRAQRDDRPSDLLRSLDAAQRAVAADAKLPAAQFNLAMADEALGFTTEARAAWDRAAQADRSGWSDEAAAHRTAIERAAARNEALQWRLNLKRLPEALAAHDHRALVQLVRPFPNAAQNLLEEQLLPAWGKTLIEGHPAEAGRQLRDATAIAMALSEATGDPYMRDVVTRIAGASGDDLRQLAKGHVAYGKARAVDRSYDFAAAEAAYGNAADLLARAGSPLSIGAELGRATETARIREDKQEPKATLVRIEEESRRHGYLHVRGRAIANQANLLQIEGRYLDAINAYNAASAIFEQIDDAENLANVHIRKAGIFRVIGQEEAAMSEALLARGYSDRVVEMPTRHLLAGETSSTVLALDYPSIAFAYQSAFITALEQESANAPGDATTTKAIRVNRAIALRARAAIRLHLGDHKNADRELAEASEIVAGLVSPRIRNALRARIAEGRGEAALPANPRVAIQEFTEAIRLSGPLRYRTFETILLARRAEAYRLLGDLPAAERDLVAAIALLNEEEADLLAGRRRGQGEELWGDYFSRFQETYHRLIGLLLMLGRKEEAFAYAEKSRAFEPLKLVLDLPLANEALRALDTKSVNPKALGTIRAALPAGTFLLEYQVGDDGAYVWIVSRDDFDVHPLPVTAKSIREWSRTLQREAVTGDSEAFERYLSEPYKALFEVPLAALGKMKNGRMPGKRLVIVPGRFMHGLPFAALTDQHGRHLIENYVVSVAPSATLYLHASARDQQLAAAGGEPKELLVGDPAFDEQLEVVRGLRRLRFAHLEATDAAALYGPKAITLLGERATVSAFLAQSRDKTLIHLAAHALVNRHAPFGALLLMAPGKSKDGKRHNGLLYADELLTALALDRARLVVLAACSSAGGVPVGPQGLAPLVRPFVAAGVPGIVGSLWTIDDHRSQKVLVEFHRQYKNGHDAARALQLAQIRFLKEGNAAMPTMAWAPFQVVGYASSPFTGKEPNKEANR